MKKLSLSTKVLIGVILGIILGLLFGDHVGWLSIPGDIFIGLLQMTVLPYIMFSLIVNIGRLSMDTGKKIVKNGLIFLALLLSLGILYLFILPLAFPQWGSGSFYSSDFVQESPPFDFVKLYIPANPFESMSNNIVPAVVMFSIFIGLGVMKLPQKETLLKPLDILTTGLNEVNKMVVKITPLGVFCIAAGVVSKLSWSDLSRLQGYLLVYLLAVILMTFVILPYIISIFTPYSTKTIFRITKSTLITIFATGKIIVVFPQLIENIKEILKSQDRDTDVAKAEVDIIMPLAYPFPNLGTFMIFIFVPFAAWYSGEALQLLEFPIFLSSTLLSSFVAPITGLPFSLDLLSIPRETFQLFVVSTVLTDRIRVVLGAFHLITLTILTISATNGFIKLRKRKFTKALIVTALVTVVSIYGLQLLLKKSMSNIPTNEEIINRVSLISDEQPYKILDYSHKIRSKAWRNENTLSRINRLNTIRVGYYPNSIPFAFINKDSALVGYGIDLAHQLAKDLKASIEFVPIAKGELVNSVKHKKVDIIMSDIFLSSEYAALMELSKPYLNISLALLTKKDNTNFDTYDNAVQLDTFNLSYFERPEIAQEYLTYFPKGNAIKIDDYDQIFDDVDSAFIKVDSIKIDAHLTSAERAAAITVVYPGFKVVNPLPYHVNNALVFPIVQDLVWRRYIDNWIDFRTHDGVFQRIYDQWILGKEYKKHQKPWSVYDNIILPKLNEKDLNNTVTN